MKDARHTWSGQELPIWMAQECPAAVNAETKFWRARACASLRDELPLRASQHYCARARKETPMKNYEELQLHVVVGLVRLS